MAQTIELEWKDGTGDKVKVEVTESQNIIFKFNSDPHKTMSDRKRTINVMAVSDGVPVDSVDLVMHQPLPAITEGIGVWAIGVDFVIS